MIRKKKYEAPQQDDDTGLEWTEAFRDMLREMVETEGPLYEDIYGKRTDSVDYSFLEKNPHNVKKRYITYLARASVLVISFLIAGLGFGVWINSQPANALKFEAEKKFYEMKGGGFSTEEVEGMADNQSLSIEINDMNDIERAKKVMDDLPVPEYIPEGYQLAVLTTTIAEKEGANAEYLFKKRDKEFGIGILRTKTGSGYKIKTEGEIIQRDGRQLCIWEDKLTSSVGCSFFIDNLEICIVGNLSQEEMFEVARNLK